MPTKCHSEDRGAYELTVSRILSMPQLPLGGLPIVPHLVGCTLSIPQLRLGGLGDRSAPLFVGCTLSIPQLPLGGFHEDGRVAIYLADWSGFEARMVPLPSSTTTNWLALMFS